MNTRISQDLVKDAVYTKLERNLELPVILQTLENKGFNNQLMEMLGGLFDHELQKIKAGRSF